MQTHVVFITDDVASLVGIALGNLIALAIFAVLDWRARRRGKR